MMAALKDHLAVGLMLLGDIWPWALAAALVPVGLVLWRLRSGAWRDRRSRRAALVGFLAGAVAGVFGAFELIGGAWSDLGYWIDWLFLGVLAVGAGAYVALLAYLGTGPASTGRA